MHQAGDDFLTRARLTLQQDRGICGSNFDDERTDVLNGVTYAHQALIEVFEVALSCGVLGGHVCVSLFLN